MTVWVSPDLINNELQQSKCHIRCSQTGLKTSESGLVQPRTRLWWNQDSLTMHSGLAELSSASWQHGAFMDRWLLRNQNFSFTLQSCCQTWVVRKVSQELPKKLQTRICKLFQPWVSSLHLLSHLTAGLKRRPPLATFKSRYDANDLE